MIGEQGNDLVISLLPERSFSGRIVMQFKFDYL